VRIVSADHRDDQKLKITPLFRRKLADVISTTRVAFPESSRAVSATRLSAWFAPSQKNSFGFCASSSFPTLEHHQNICVCCF
jgi:hypothetical protein